MFRDQAKPIDKFKVLGKSVGETLLGALPVIFQSLIQWFKYGQFTPLPVSDLGAKQIIWGIQNVKYATWHGKGDSPRNYYSSEKLIGVANPEGLSWYWENPIPALNLILHKLVGAFDFDFLVPYPDSSFGLSWLFSSISFLTLIVGGLACVIHVFRPMAGLGPRWLPSLIVLSWGSIALLSALELRFTLPILAYLGILQVIFTRSFLRSARSNKIMFLLFTIIIFYWLWVIAYEVRSFSVLNQA